MRGPADHWLENAAAISEGAPRFVARGIDEIMGVARGIREVVNAVVFVHPRPLEIAAVVTACEQRLALFVENAEFGDVTLEGLHVGAEFGHAGADGGFMVGRLTTSRI